MNWIKRQIKNRSPESHSVILKHSILYIVPSLRGFLYWCAVLLIWLIGSNYQNNLILALSFLLISIGIIAAINTYLNLSGITISVKSVVAAYAGEQVALYLQCNVARAFQGQALHLFVGKKWLTTIYCQESITEVLVPLPSEGMRGYFTLPQLIIRSTYPFGLFSIWSYLHLAPKVWIYPKPLNNQLQLSVGTSLLFKNSPLKNESSDDFSGFRSYQPGDTLNRIAWKQYARLGHLLIKERLAEEGGQQQWLDYAQCKSATVEDKLSELCFQILKLEKTGASFGLRLPGQVIAVSVGRAHVEQCLQALSLYNKLPDPEEWYLR